MRPQSGYGNCIVALELKKVFGQKNRGRNMNSLSGNISTAGSGVNLTGSTDFGVITAGSVSGAEREFIVYNGGSLPFTFNATLSNSSFVFVSGRSATVAARGGIARIGSK